MLASVAKVTREYGSSLEGSRSLNLAWQHDLMRPANLDPTPFSWKPCITWHAESVFPGPVVLGMAGESTGHLLPRVALCESEIWSGLLYCFFEAPSAHLLLFLFASCRSWMETGQPNKAVMFLLITNARPEGPHTATEQRASKRGCFWQGSDADPKGCRILRGPHMQPSINPDVMEPAPETHMRAFSTQAGPDSKPKGSM